ncbi:hypothetical protein RRSWK_03207 [Rhodopirellula sp. SWK7]|nr:hypothetical protein RRSWK_03207 [Rhodopirellula sp. SWK7]
MRRVRRRVPYGTRRIVRIDETLAMCGLKCEIEDLRTRRLMCIGSATHPQYVAPKIERYKQAQF